MEVCAAEHRRAFDSTQGRPNIVVFLADDLGYGDVSCYNPEARVATSNLDRLAREGMRFTDAHIPGRPARPYGRRGRR
jgi:arylsulfatase A-like enzyme